MAKIAVLLILALTTGTIQCLPSEEDKLQNDGIPADAYNVDCATTSKRVDRVYVYRRPLLPLKYLFKYGPLAHSGLILRLEGGAECVLEYMGDGEAHLYNADYEKIGSSWIAGLRKAYSLKFTDYLGDTYDSKVSRQYYGTQIGRGLRVTPKYLKGTMQGRMGYNYDLLQNNCHIAQEKTRRAIGLKVDHPFIFPSNKDQLCRWIKSRSSGRDLYKYIRNPYAMVLITYCHISRRF